METSNTLAWEPFNDDQKQLEFAVEAAKYNSENENHPIYVCRATIDGIAVPGHTQKRNSKMDCVISMHETHLRPVFDVLLNKGNGGKLTWKPWRKNQAVFLKGAVSAATDGHVCNFHFFNLNSIYIARERFSLYLFNFIVN